ncbi:MAG TPA: hypothetical protein VGQ59_07865 [Cyclobacteriaceae bacterium]|jgi:hypothetical protein|nr:hypothetical protein [Cyclobacteriaceae bacterium]
MVYIILFLITAQYALNKSATTVCLQPHNNAIHLLSAESFKTIGWIQLVFLFLIKTDVNGQVIPNLLINDNYRPYLTEEQKRQELFKAPKTKTSQELYPELYKYQNQNDFGQQLMNEKKIPNPNTAFTNQAEVEFNSSIATPTQQINYGIPKSLYENGLSIEQRNQMMIDADLRAYEQNNVRSQQILNVANQELFTPTINYTLGIHNGLKADRFVKSYNELESMLDGRQPIDFVKAAWLVESAHDQTLTWKEFNGMFQDGVEVISALMLQDKVSLDDNLSKVMSIFKYMTDTTKVYIKAKERNIVSKPMLYDYEDYAGKKDITKVFVSKLLRTGSGQCMSLPMLYYMYAKMFRADVYIAFAPQHSYVTFKDNLGNWQNIELTARMFIATDYHWQSGFITTEQVKSGIYLRPSTEKETIAYLMTTLALSYVKTIGTDDRVLQMATTAKQYFPRNLTANMIYAGYYNDLWNNIVRQYESFQMPKDKFNNDEQARTIKQKAEAAVSYVKRDLGWKEMPDWAYKKWLEGMNNLANKGQHIIRRRQLELQLNRHK